MANIRLIDSHTHLDSEEFDSDREQAIARATEAGVVAFVCIGASRGVASNEHALKLAHSYKQIFATIGLRPHDTDRPLDMSHLSKMAEDPKVVAIGETGLDYFRDWAPRDKQLEWFEAHIQLAIKLKKPLIIHSRGAAADCLNTIIRTGASAIGGVFHCYSEDADFERSLRAHNFLVSFPGNLTFKKAHLMHAAAKDIPLDRIMLETDAPYLAPEPHRGKRCESAFIVETAKKLAEIKGISLEEVAQATTQNALRFFKLEGICG